MTSKSIISQCAALLEQGKAAEAEKNLIPILKKEPDNFHALQLFGLARHLLGAPQDALKILEKALNINPNFSALRHNLAGVYRSLGHMKKAQENYRKAIALKPDYAEAYQGLAEVIRFKKDDPLIKKLQAQINSNPESVPASYLHFAAGKIYDDCGEYSRAFKHFSTGNKLTSKHWDSQKHAAYQTAIMKTYNADYFARRSKRGCETASPIFIVGMPRSGSTLLEQILASHSQIFGAGEINDIPSIADQIGKYSKDKSAYPECMREMPAEVFAGMGGAYINRVATLNYDKAAAKHSIDKNLLNINQLGLISDLLPRSHIIHIQRHPLDTCLSCFFQNFSTGVQWSFSLENIATYYRRYREVMAHWEAVLPVPVLPVRYEELVSQQEASSRKLIAFCKLNWEDDCLQFHRNDRVVKTASVWQVRQPIYTRSKDRWNNYLSHIAMLKESLADYIEAYEDSLQRDIPVT